MRQSKPIWIVIAVVAVLSVFGVFQGPRIAFERSIRKGQTVDEVKRLCGVPDLVLQPGELLDRWGNRPAMQVKNEVLIYYVFPQSQNRFTVHLRDGIVEHVEHDLN